MVNTSAADNESVFSLRLNEQDDLGLPGLAVQAPSSPLPDYSHHLYRLYWANNSNVQLLFNTQPITLKQGYMLTLSPGDDVCFSDDVSMRSLCFHHNFFCVRVQRDEVYCDGVVFNRLADLPIVAFPEGEKVIINARLDELTHILKDQGPLANDRALGELRAMLLHAADFKLRQLDTESELELGNAQRLLSPLVVGFQNLVEHTYTQRKDVSYYSDALGVTPATLNRHVKDELGQTVMQAVNERLAIAARVALRGGDQSVKQVAFALGFDDPLYFSRFFKKQFGRSPSQYFQKV